MKRGAISHSFRLQTADDLISSENLSANLNIEVLHNTSALNFTFRISIYGLVFHKAHGVRGNLQLALLRFSRLTAIVQSAGFPPAK